MTQPTEHDHEAWQIRESAKGGHYCAACGQRITTTTDEEQQP